MRFFSISAMPGRQTKGKGFDGERKGVTYRSEIQVTNGGIKCSISTGFSGACLEGNMISQQAHFQFQDLSHL